MFIRLQRGKAGYRSEPTRLRAGHTCRMEHCRPSVTGSPGRAPVPPATANARRRGRSAGAAYAGKSAGPQQAQAQRGDGMTDTPAVPARGNQRRLTQRGGVMRDRRRAHLQLTDEVTGRGLVTTNDPHQNPGPRRAEERGERADLEVVPLPGPDGLDMVPTLARSLEEGPATAAATGTAVPGTGQRRQASAARTGHRRTQHPGPAFPLPVRPSRATPPMERRSAADDGRTSRSVPHTGGRTSTDGKSGRSRICCRTNSARRSLP